MLNLNTNLSAFIAQKSLTNASKLLNQAIERMSTGYKINSSADNAANYAITERMTTQLSSLDVAEDNTAQGIDVVSTATETLDLINERFIRLRNLAMQAENKTYGEDSLNAINLECEALVEEIKRIYTQAEYNGLKIFGSEFFETIPTTTTYASPSPSIFATEDTTLQELGIDESSFQIYSSDNEIIESYETEKTDTLKDIFRVLSNYGISSSIADGVISISSYNGRYVNGDLMRALGIELEQTDFISSSTQNSDSALYYTTTMTATESTTLADIGVLTSGTDTISVKNKYGDNIANFNVNSTTTLGGLFNSLGNYDIQGEIDDGVITLSSTVGNYLVSQGVIANLGISNTQSSSAVTTGTSQTSANIITYETVIISPDEVTTIQQEVTTTIWTTTTTSTTNTSIQTVGGEQVTATSDKLYVATRPSYTDAEVAAMTRVKDATNFVAGEAYSIYTVEDLLRLPGSRLITKGVTFVLGADIDLSSVSNWVPIGYDYEESEEGFAGTFDGNGHVISNLYINNSEYDQGLFGTVNGGTIKNLGLEDVDITARSAGALVGRVYEASIENCYVTGTVKASNTAGGISASSGEANIMMENNYFKGSVISSNGSAGGLIGDASSDVYLQNNYVIADVSGNNYVGGLVGKANTDGNEFYNNFVEGTVVGNNYVGGFIGSYTAYDFDYTDFDKNFSLSTVSGSSNVGGFFGNVSTDENGSDPEVTNCYGIQADSQSTGATVKTAEEIRNLLSYETMEFTESNGWSIVDDNLVLSWQLPSIATLDTTLVELGYTNDVFIAMVNPNSQKWSPQEPANSFSDSFSTYLDESFLILQFGKGCTIRDVVDAISITKVEIGNNSATASFTDGVLTITSAKGSYINDIANLPEMTNLFAQLDYSKTETLVSYEAYVTTTVTTTTTTSTTETSTIDVVQTIEGSTTTANVSITSATTFADLGLSSRAYITVMNDTTKAVITIKTADTVASVMSSLNNAGINTDLADGQLTISSNDKKIYISGMSDSLRDIFNFENDFYSTSLGVEMTDSNIFIYDGETTVRQTTSLAEIGITSGELVVKKDGQEYSTIVVSDSQTVNELLTDLRNAGFSAKCTNGIISIKAEGDMELTNSSSNSSNAISTFKLGSVQQVIESTYANKDSSEINKLSEIVNKFWKASSAISLQVGIGYDEHSSIEISTGFTIENLDKFANIGKNMVSDFDYITHLDKILETINTKQTQLGASENRLMSVMEEISIKYDNLLSSRSTLRDVDIAEESSLYIQQQILQQASATLLSVANQTPQLALQLL